jgi:hypothetical protein
MSTELINLKIESPMIDDLKEILLSFCECKLDTSYFLGNPETYICNIQKFSQYLASTNRLSEIFYSKNRKPNENDPERTSKIIAYQQLKSIVLPSGEDKFIYDTADWKITFGTLKNKNMVVIDGQHRLLASKELPNIVCYVQILDFDDEYDRFEKFKIINISTDLPDIYRMSDDDIYKNLGIQLKDRIKDLGWYVPKNYKINIDCGRDFNLPYLLESDFVNFLMKRKDLIFGKILDIVNETVLINRIVNMFISINVKLMNNIFDRSYSAGEFINFAIKLKNTSTQSDCHGLNVSQKCRCTSRGKYGNPLMCGIHKDKMSSFIDPDFIKIREEIRKSKCAIGLLTESELERDIKCYIESEVSISELRN